jgi:hypothetical protein
MTQYLLSAAPNLQLEPGYEARPVKGTRGLVAAADSIFPDAETASQIQPTAESMDVLVDTARGRVLLGAPIDETELGRILTLLAKQGDFALFWAGDYEELPTVVSLEDVWAVVESQLRTHDGHWELAVRFCLVGGG